MLPSNRRKPTMTKRPASAGPRPASPAARRALEKSKAPKRYALFAVGSVLAVVVAMAVNPPTGSVHSFTSASDYRVSKDSGCTNSGAGCHGEETAYTDFNAYHPDAECLDCHEYEGVGCIPCHAPREHECALCHDGSMKNAPDRVRLTDPYPHGHYREASHTVDPDTMSRPVRASAVGKAKATCDQCHDQDLRTAHTKVPVVEGSEYGSDIGCGECHNDVRASGQAEVLSDWKVRDCESCHKVSSSAPMHGVDSLSVVEATDKGRCGDTGTGCHASSDLHALHADKPLSCSGTAAEGEPGCHDFDIESHAPQARGCGGNGENDCHRGDNGREYLHENMDAHAADTSVASDTSFYGVACGECHAINSGTSGLLELHGVSQTADASSKACTGCHNGASTRTAVANGDTACQACHGGTDGASLHAADLEAKHEVANGSEGCASTGTGCHPGSSLFAVGSAAGALHDSCTRCHAASAGSGNLAFDPNSKTCGSSRDCHAAPGQFDPATGAHGIDGATVGGTDAQHHVAGTGLRAATYRDAISGVETRCDACHSAILGTEHTRPASVLAGTNVCVRCHNVNATSSAVVKAGWPQKNTSRACSSCHDGSTGTPAPHSGMSTAHLSSEVATSGLVVAGSCAKDGCHGSADVRVLHRAKGCAFQDCHAATGNILGTGLMRCGGGDGEQTCHARSTLHRSYETTHQAIEISDEGYAVPGTCVKAGCHATVDSRTLHEKKSGCETDGCHNSAGPSSMTCGGPAGMAGTCHVATKRHAQLVPKHQAVELDRNNNPVPGSCMRGGCHSTRDVRDLHAKKNNCTTAGCHVEGGLKVMTCGGNDSAQGSCHVASKRHAQIEPKHVATELDRNGQPLAGSCVRGGCHATADVRTLHETLHCSTPGCHVTGGPTNMTCGGPDGNPLACHTSSQRHLDKDAKHIATQLDSSNNPLSTSCVRAGCHATADVRTIHETTHCETPGCHVTGGPTNMTCGGSDAAVGSCHLASQRHLDKDAKHMATELDKNDVPTPGSCVRAGCHATTDVRTIHSTTRCSTAGCHTTGGPTNMSCGGSDANTAACHTLTKRHLTKDAKHQGTELTPSGEAVSGTCVTSGCHATLDVRTLHATTHCETSGCHTTGGPTTASCGGGSCHAGFSASSHAQSHAADLVGTVNGITYGGGENEGCLGGCHSADLIAEHELAAGANEGSAENVCRVCHYMGGAPGAGTYSSAGSVVAAIANHDRRCVACHSSGSNLDTGGTVASPPSTCVPSLGAMASEEPVSTASIVSAIRTITDSATVDPAGTDEPVTGSGGGDDSSTDTSSTPREPSTDPTGTADPSGEPTTAPGGGDQGTDTPGTPPDEPGGDPKPDAEPEPKDDPKPPTQDDVDCPAQGSSSDKEAPDLSPAKLDKDACKKCHDVKEAPSPDAAAQQEDNR